MGSNKDVQMITCLGKRGPYTFYKSIKLGEQTLSLSQFFPVKIWPDSTILSVAEVQLLWSDKSEHFCSLRLYFLPENTPEGRRSHHGEDEVLALHDKVIIRASDLSSWLVDESDWHWGLVIPHLPKEKPPPPPSALSKAFLSEKYRKNDKVHDTSDARSNQLVVLNYVRYSRLRGVLKRLEGSNELSNWLSHPLVLALGGRDLGPSCRLLFAKEVFDYPELEDHELLCNHLAPKLKGRPRRGGRKRNPSLGSESNESEASSAGSRASEKAKKAVNGVWKPKFDLDKPRSPNNMHSRNLGNPLAAEINSNEIKVENEQNGKADGTKRRSTRRKRTYSHLENENSPVSSEGSATSGKASNDEDVKDVPADGNENTDKVNMTPTRPSVITIKENATVPEPEYPKTKKMKTETNAINSVDSGDKSDSPTGSGSPVTRNIHETITSIIASHALGSLTDTKITPSTGVKFDGHYVDKKHAILGQKASRSVVNKPTKPGLPPQFDTDYKKPQSIPLGFCSPSPFISTLYYASPKIYGDPVFRKNPSQQQSIAPSVAKVDSKYRPNITTPVAASNGILDFSVRKCDATGKDSTSSVNLNAKVGTNSLSNILNLSFKPGSTFSGAGTNTNIFRNLADIPPPNAMNKAGMKLTSEVTLLPRLGPPNMVQQQMHAQQQAHVLNSHQKPKRDNTSNRMVSGRAAAQAPANYPQHLHPAAQVGPSNQRSRNVNPPANMPQTQQGAPMNRPGASNSMSSTTNPSSHVWRPMATPPGSSKAPTFSVESQLHHASTNNYPHNSKSTKSSATMHGNRDQMSAPPNSQAIHRNSSMKVSQQLAALQQQERAAAVAAQEGREREAREKAREMETWSAAGFPPFLQPSYYPKIDPSHYMPLFGAPFLLPPAANLMGLPPGTMEQLQLYKDLLLQQRLPPQFQPPGWPPHLGNGGSAGGGNHNSTKERK